MCPALRFISLVLLVTASMLQSVRVAEAGLLFHASSKAAARIITARGFSQRLMNPGSRFGKGVYFATTRKTALKERPDAKAFVVARTQRGFSSKLLDTRRMKTGVLKSISGQTDARGMVKHDVIGPKIGHRVGTYASRKGRVVEYRSARTTKGTNVFIPAKVNGMAGNRLYKILRTEELR